MQTMPNQTQLSQLTHALVDVFANPEPVSFNQFMENQLDLDVDWLPSTEDKHDLIVMISDLVLYFASQENGIKYLLANVLAIEASDPTLINLANEWRELDFKSIDLPNDHPSKKANNAKAEMVSSLNDRDVDTRDVTADGHDIVQGSKVVGGDEVRGDKVFGDKVAGHKIVYLGEEVYDVRGLANPYLGLAAFTYAERERYAGRNAEIEQAIRLLTTPGSERTLLFVTGSSGSGKSSFAQAGLLPALERHYQQQSLIFNAAVFRPGEKPLAALAGALRTLNLSADGIFAPVAEYQLAAEDSIPDKRQISLLIIDQFEEIFTQSVSDQQKSIFTMLENIPTFRDLQLHVIATMRADYLPDLFEYEAIYEIAKNGIDLRAMTEEQLQLAIQRPVQVFHPNIRKRFQEALLNRLAEDAAEDSAYLPLLQVTLEDLWRTGILTIDYYENLINAIRKNADQIFETRQDADGNIQKRTPEEQRQILDIFLAMVDVSVDDMNRRDVRRTRTLDDLTNGDTATERLIQDLATARLLTTDEKIISEDDSPVETVDIIHESLLLNWSQLNNAIQDQREHLRQRSRFELRLDEWTKSEQPKERLLKGLDLAEAENLQQSDDVAIRGSTAKGFISASTQERDRIRRRNQRNIATVAAVLGVLLLVAASTAWQLTITSENLEVERDTAQKAATGEALALVTSEARGTAVAIEATRAYTQQIVAESAAITAEAEARRARSEELSQIVFRRIQEQGSADDVTLMLAQDAVNMTLKPDGHIQPNASLAMVEAVNMTIPSQQIPTCRHAAAMVWAEFNNEGTKIVTSSLDGTAKLWNVNTGACLLTLVGHTNQVNSATFSPSGKEIITASSDGTVKLWDATDGSLSATIINGETSIIFAAFSPDGDQFAWTESNGSVYVSSTSTGEVLTEFDGHTARTRSVQFNSTGDMIVTASSDGTAKIWDVQSGSELKKLEHESSVLYWASFSTDNEKVVTTTDSGTTTIWSTSTGEIVERLIEESCEAEGACQVSQAVFDSGDKRLITAYDKFASIWDDENRDSSEHLSGHTSTVLSVNIHPNQELLVTASDDGTAKIWDLATNDVVMTLGGHSGGTRSAVFSPDGAEMLYTSDDPSPRVWNIENQTERLSLVGHDLQTRSAHFSSDGKRIITGSDDGTAKIWDAQTGEVLLTLNSHDGKVSYAVFSPDGQTIATIGNDWMVRLWDASTGEKLHEMSGHNNWTHTADFSPDGQYLVTAAEWKPTDESPSASNTVIIWEVSTGEMVRTIDGHTDGVWSAQYSPDGKFILTSGSGDSTARIWNATSGEQLYVFSGHTDWVIDANWNSDGTRIVTASNDNSAKVWDASTGQELFSIVGHQDDLRSAWFSPDDEQILTSGHDGTVRLWNLAENYDNGIVLQHSNRVFQTSYNPDGSQIAAFDVDRNLIIWDRATGKPVYEFLLPDRNIRSIVFNPEGTHIFMPDQFNPANIWDLVNDKEVVEFANEPNTLVTGEYSADGQSILSVSRNGALTLWNASTGEEIADFFEFAEDVFFATYTPEKNQVVTAGRDGMIRFMDANNGSQIRSFGAHSGTVAHVAFSRDQTRLISSGGDKMINVWDLSTGEATLSFSMDIVAYRILYWSEDKNRVVTYDVDGNIRERDYNKGNQLIFIGEDNAVFHHAIASRDAKWLLTASSSGIVREWPVEYEAWLSAAENLITRNARVLLDEERQEFGYK